MTTFTATQPQQVFYDQCESYFVEQPFDAEPAFNHNRVLTKAERKAINRERQLDIADELTRLACEQYQNDILTHMENMEGETLPVVASIDQQTEIQWYMRPYLLDFMIEMHASFGLQQETLHLAVNILDRYCSKRIVYKRHYQLVGCAAILIAAKYNDKKEHVPTIRDLRNTCGNLFDDVMFVQMEWHVLQTLDWSIGHPTIDSFLQIALAEVPYDAEVEHMAWYISEIGLYYRDFVSTKPSTLSRSALALARYVLGREEPCQSAWASRFDSVTTVNLSQKLSQPSASLARKYQSQHYSCVAILLDDFLARQAALAASQAAAAAAAAQAAAQAAAAAAVIVAPPSPPAETAVVSCEYDAARDMCLEVYAPATPIGAHHPQYMSVQHGYLTPPITPDGEHTHAKEMPLVPVRCPLTPTPTGTADTTAHLNVYHTYQPQSYPMQQ